MYQLYGEGGATNFLGIIEDTNEDAHPYNNIGRIDNAAGVLS